MNRRRRPTQHLSLPLLLALSGPPFYTCIPLHLSPLLSPPSSPSITSPMTDDWWLYYCFSRVAVWTSHAPETLHLGKSTIGKHLISSFPTSTCLTFPNISYFVLPDPTPPPRPTLPYSVTVCHIPSMILRPEYYFILNFIYWPSSFYNFWTYIVTLMMTGPSCCAALCRDVFCFIVYWSIPNNTLSSMF